jgi:PhoPQ-activated pathogenicity-related protein
VAGLDNRFKAAVPVYGCGFLHENSHWVPMFKKLGPEKTATWVQLWDPSSYVGSTTVPMLFVNGGKDFAYPPDSFARTYELVRSPKNLHFVPDMKHGHFFGRPKAVEVYIDHHLKQGVPLARIISTTVTADRITATVKAQTELVNAALHYTRDPLPGNPRTRTWHKQAATLANHTITAAPPPSGTTAWFLTVKDKRNTLVSSDLVFPKAD